jgi:hypothetical protein
MLHNGNSCFEGKKHYGDQLLLYARPDMDQFSAKRVNQSMTVAPHSMQISDYRC